MNSAKSRLREILAVPHFHYDVEWWKTDRGYNRDVKKILLKALDMLDAHPEFTYVIDQALALKPFWEKHPDRREQLRRFVREGRVELVGGTWCAPDENIPTGEAFIRQFIYGLRFLEGEVGGKVTTAWEIDEFGHPAQIPQLLRGCGFSHFVFARGVQNWEGDHPTDFFWEAPDGTRVLTHWLAGHYSGLLPLGTSRPVMRQYFREMRARIANEAPRSPATALFMPFGTDFTAPSEDWLEFAKRWNKKEVPPVRFALPRDFFTGLEKIGKRLPTVRGELNPLLTGCYESREKVKADCRSLENAAARAERWAALAWLAAGREYPKAAFDRAWELLLENDFHDIVCGTGTDRVYRGTIRRYGEAAALLADAEGGAVETISDMVDTRGRGLPLVVFNALNFDRRDVARAPLEAINERLPGGAGELVVTDADGAAVPSQVEDGELLFVASVPSVGYSTYFVSRGKPRRRAPAAALDGLTADTPFYRLEIDPARGGIASLLDKRAGAEPFDTSRWATGEIMLEEDAGNLWTVQKTGRTWRARASDVRVRPLPGGPVRSGFEISGRVECLTRTLRIYLYRDIPRIDFDIRVDFRGKDRRVKLMFESAGGGGAVFETPFYAQPRGDGHWCAQNWIDIGGPDGGAAILNTGTPGHEVAGAAVGMTLFRGVSILSAAFLRFVVANLPEISRKIAKLARMTAEGRNTGEWAIYDYHGILLREWSSEGGLELPGGMNVLDHLIPWLRIGRKSDAWERGAHRFRCALLPHAGSWADAGVTEAGLELNNPLLVMPAEKHKGKMPPAMSFLATGGAGVILSALKRAEDGDGLIARLYESRGGAAEMRLKTFMKISSAKRVNHIEGADKAAPPVLRAGAIKDSLPPYRIASYRLRF